MKNKICIFLFVLCPLLFVFYSFGCVNKEIKNIGSKGKNIICFGDSITFGYGVEPKESYPAALAKVAGVPVINMGIDGDTSIEAVKRLKSDILERDPFLVIVEFSGNDFLRKIPREVTLKNVKEMIRKIQDKGAMVAIVDISAGLFIAEYRSSFRNLAREEQAIFIPGILSGIITNPTLKSDFLHPNAQGYKMVAQKIYLAIKPYLAKNSALRNIKE